MLLAGGGYLGWYFLRGPDKSNNEITSPTATTPTPPNTPSRSLVNKSEIDCQSEDLFIISALGGKAPVDKAGNYTIEFSKEGAQLVFIATDKDELCASAISLPKYQSKVFFDAKSTAKAAVFQTIGILSTDPTEAEQRLTMIENLISFPALYAYVQENLPKSNLNQLNNASNFSLLIENCVQEMVQTLGKPQ